MKPSSLVSFVTLALLFIGASSGNAVPWQEEYDQLLQKYVTPAGVRYAAWKGNAGDLAALQRVVDGIAAAPASTAKDAAQLAFHINAYNAWILHQALAKYPTKSVRDTLFLFFTSNRIKVAGETMSFNRLEKEIIRPRFNEPRIHFALNCASQSCPPLAGQSYTGKDLERQLEGLTTAFINSDKGVRVTKNGAELSMIFKWYQEDFSARGGVVPFINKYRSSPVPAGAKISYQKYDWSLNETK